MYSAPYYKTKIQDNKQEDPASCKEIFTFWNKMSKQIYFMND